MRASIPAILGIAAFGLFLYSVAPVLTPLLLLFLVWFFLFPLREAAWARRILCAASVFFVLWLLSRIWPVVGPFVAGAVIAYLLGPLVDKFERIGFPRLLAAIVLVLVLLGIVIALSLLFLPTVASQIKEIISHLPALANTISEFIATLEQRLERFGVPPGTVDIAGVRERVLDTDTLLERLAHGALDVTKAVTSAVGTIINLLLVVVVSFYLLVEMNRLLAWADSLIPRASRNRVARVFREIDSIIGSWFRGQLTIALVVGILTTAGLTILSTPYAAFIGLIAGVLNIIPTIGLIISLGVAVVLTPTVAAPLSYLLKIGIVFAVVQILDNLVISAQIMSSRMGLHPAIVIFSVIVFAYLFGAVGVLIAIPTVSLLRYGSSEMISVYKNMEFYTTNEASKDREED